MTCGGRDLLGRGESSLDIQMHGDEFHPTLYESNTEKPIRGHVMVCAGVVDQEGRQLGPSLASSITSFSQRYTFPQNGRTVNLHTVF